MVEEETKEEEIAVEPTDDELLEDVELSGAGNTRRSMATGEGAKETRSKATEGISTPTRETSEDETGACSTGSGCQDDEKGDNTVKDNGTGRTAGVRES